MNRSRGFEDLPLRVITKDRTIPFGQPQLCAHVEESSRLCDVCECSAREIWRIASTQEKPFAACCAAMGKEIATPFYCDGNLEAVVAFVARSPRFDEAHFAGLVASLGLESDALKREWENLPEFGTAQAEMMAELLHDKDTRSRLSLPTSATFDVQDAERIMDLARAYEQTVAEGRDFFELDIRVYGMIEGLRALPDVQAVDAAYASAGSPSLVRFFSRDLGPMLPPVPPIIGTFGAEDVAQRLGAYVEEYAHDVSSVQARADNGTTLATHVMGLSHRQRHDGRHTYSFGLDVPSALSEAGTDLSWVAAADVHLSTRSLRLARTVHACLVSASDWTDVTVLGELTRRLGGGDVEDWNSFRTLLSQTAHFLDDPALSRTEDNWKRVMLGLDAALWDKQLLRPDPYESGFESIARDVLTELGKYDGRQDIDKNAAQSLLAKVSAHALAPSAF